MYVDCGACAGLVPNGVGGSDCNEGSRSTRRGREEGGPVDVGVDENGSLEGVRAWVTIMSLVDDEAVDTHDQGSF